MTILHHHRQTRPDALAKALQRIDFKPALDVEALIGRKRFRIWEISPNLHCSIVGTCLTTADVRQLLVRLGEPTARTASDHELHHYGVTAAGTHDVAGKMLNKALDKKHQRAIRRVSHARNANDLLEIWRETLDEGDISGGYWATLSHPACDPSVVREVFGEVHMLSHLVGQSNRLDLARLRKLEIALAEASEKIARQEERLRQSSLERAELIQKADALQSDLSQRLAAAQATSERALKSSKTLHRPERAAAAEARAELLAYQNEQVALSLEQERECSRILRQELEATRREIGALERLLAPSDKEQISRGPDLSGVTLLYVGGRPSLVEQLRTVVEQRGGRLLNHDGGVEDSSALMPGLLSQADRTYFPVDCVSHNAVEQIKKFARQSGKPFTALRNASVASLVGALAGLEDRAPTPGQ